VRETRRKEDRARGRAGEEERLAFAYVLEGTLTELRDGEYVKQYEPGGCGHHQALVCTSLRNPSTVA
jgi:hypothetical protein